MIRLRPISKPFSHFLGQARGILGLWAKVVGVIVAVTLVFGLFAPLVILAALMTLGLPILLLTLWGKSLDQELGWTDIDEGPW